MIPVKHTLRQVLNTVGWAYPFWARLNPESDTASARLSEAGFFCVIFVAVLNALYSESLLKLPYLLIFCCACCAQASTPVPFGIPVQFRDTVRSVDIVGAGASDVSQLASLDDAEATLREMEQTLGPYHSDLAAQMLQVAHLASSEGEFALAAGWYDRALHNARVNNGLYGDQQLPILRGLLDLYLLSGDRAGFEARAAYQFRLLGSGLPPFEEGELQAAIEFFEASLDALMGVSWESRSRELLRLHERFESMAEAVCADPAVNVRWCQPFTFSLGRFYYLLEYKLEAFVDDPRFERTFSDPDWQSLDREPRLDALQRRLFGKGEENFQRLVTLAADSHDALSALADWNWFYRKRDAAVALYRQACNLAPERFVRAGPLPEYPRLAFELAFQEPPVPVMVSLSVTDRGRPTDLEFSLPGAPNEASPPGAVRRAMRNMVFRPAFISCEEMVGSTLELDLVYID